MQASPTSTSANAEDAMHENLIPPDAEATLLSDPNSPLRVHVKRHTSIYVKAYKDIITNVLDQMPNTEAYQKSRQQLDKILERIDQFVNELVNCIWNIVDLQHVVKMNYLYFIRKDATPEELKTAQLLLDNGYEDTRKELGVVWSSFIDGEFGTDYNEDYCQLKN